MTHRFLSPLLILLIMSITLSGSIISAQPNQDRQQRQSQQIYGIRWFFGDYFAFRQQGKPHRSQEMFILMFNSEEELDDQIYLKIDGTRYGCYERFLEIESAGQHHYEVNKQGSKVGENFTNAMYKCIVYAQDFQGRQQVDYQIVSGWMIFQGTGNMTVVKKYREYVLFEGKLRLPQNMPKLSYFFLADWGLISQQAQKEFGYKDVRPSLIKQLKQDPTISMLIFGGDLAYDFQGQIYIKMLKYLQPITSTIITIATPGNHDSIYHQDSLQLYVQSFYSPLWYSYFNYFSLIQLQSQKLIILTYDPQSSVFPQYNRLAQNLTQIFLQQLSSTITAYIKQNYDVIVLSHYPMHCSEQGEHYQTCQQNQVRFKAFMQKFEDMGVDLYLSGHLHIYQRTKPICKGDQKDFRQTTTGLDNMYTKDCPIFVVDGSAGNTMWVEMTQRYQKKNFSASIVLKTGYGIGSVQKRNLTYQHIQVQQNENYTVADKFTLYQPYCPMDQTAGIQENGDIARQKMQQRFILVLQIIALVIILGFSVCLIYKLIKKKRTSPSQKKPSHIQMIQENFQTPNHNNKTNQTKQEHQIE